MPYSTIFPVLLSTPNRVAPSLVEVEDVTQPAITGNTALVVLGYQLSSQGILTSLSPVVVGDDQDLPLQALVTIPSDGVYQFQACRVLAQEGVSGEYGLVGEIRYDYDTGKLFQCTVEAPEGVDHSTWVSTNLDYSALSRDLGGLVYYLHLSSLTQTYNTLLLRILESELGPPQKLNQPQVNLLLDYLGKVERGLQGASYLFEDENLSECARVLELLSLSSYL